MLTLTPHQKMNRLNDELSQAYFTFKPRPNQPERYDQQEAFVDSETTGVKWLIGGNGAGTSECALYAASQFMLQKQPPPRRDTPFWVISNTYESTIETAWKEKLHGHGHIPNSEIDWPRVQWYKSKQGLPSHVPLKPWPGRPGKNWMIEFKSYDQGRERMQARAIGGFVFIEQFPYEILTEVLRGCREYNFPGSKMCEFTPVDPERSARIEEMIENDAMPAGWEVFRANTECAMEAGHVSKEWFEEYYGMVPEEMRLTRLIGAFASYEGMIYQAYNPAIHLIDVKWPPPPNCHFRRAMDWGSGPHNPTVCLWMYRNGVGQWFVYDEYWSTDQQMTILDHLCEIADRWPWPKNNPHYGTTWSDPSALESIRIAQNFSAWYPDREPFNISLASNSVLEGIDAVRYHLKINQGLGQPLLFIDKTNCPNLRREMKTYRWLTGNDNALNPRDARPEPLKRDDHAVDALRYGIFSEMKLRGDTLPKSAKRVRRELKSYGIQLHKGKRG